jgi:uncharacterized protein
VTYRYTDTPEQAEKRAEVRPTHREYLRGLADQGLLLASGPYAPDEPPGALLLYRADAKAAVEDAVAKDPFSTGGLVAEATITEWVPGTGPLAGSF